jgi:hypothetical protein
MLYQTPAGQKWLTDYYSVTVVKALTGRIAEVIKIAEWTQQKSCCTLWISMLRLLNEFKELTICSHWTDWLNSKKCLKSLKVLYSLKISEWLRSKPWITELTQLGVWIRINGNTEPKELAVIVLTVWMTHPFPHSLKNLDTWNWCLIN